MTYLDDEDSLDLQGHALRKKAARRAWFCPGAGFALLGQRPLAVLTFLGYFSFLAAFSGLLLHPSATAAYVTLATLLGGLTLWIIEQVAVKRITIQTPGPWVLAEGFLVSTGVLLVGTIIVLVLLFSNIRSLRLLGSGMEPTLAKGELFLYHTRVEPERLKRGAVIVFKLSDRTAWGQPGWITISRILAVPGDRLSVQGGNYLVNGKPGPLVAVTDPHKPVIDPPQIPEALTVPDDCYFMVQDSPAGGYDSRVLSWAESRNIVATQLLYLRSPLFFQRIE